MSISSDELHKLSVAERLELIEAIWDSIVDEPDAPPITDAQRQELVAGSTTMHVNGLSSAPGTTCAPDSIFTAHETQGSGRIGVTRR